MGKTFRKWTSVTKYHSTRFSLSGSEIYSEGIAKEKPKSDPHRTAGGGGSLTGAGVVDAIRILVPELCAAHMRTSFRKISSEWGARRKNRGIFISYAALLGARRVVFL